MRRPPKQRWFGIGKGTKHWQGMLYVQRVLSSHGKRRYRVAFLPLTTVETGRLNRKYHTWLIRFVFPCLRWQEKQEGDPTWLT